MALNGARKWMTEMDVVEQNLRKLLQQAEELPEPKVEEDRLVFVRRKYQLMNGILFYTTHINSLGMDFVMEGQIPHELPLVLSRLQLLQQEAWTHVVPFLDPSWKDFSHQHSGCPSPLVLYLKLALASEPNQRLDQYQVLDRVRSLLQQLKIVSYAPAGRKIFPGMPLCVMALCKPNSPTLKSFVTSSKDSYRDRKLDVKSDQIRKARLAKLHEWCSKSDQDRIEAVRACSTNFMQGVKDCHALDTKAGSLRPRNEDFERFIKTSAADLNQKRVVLGGNDSTLATWKPDGEQMPSCILDHYRFRTTRPDYNSKPSLSIYTTESCAEWFGFVELLASGIDMEDEELLSTLMLD